MPFRPLTNLEIDDSTLDHLVIEIVSFTRSLSDSSEHRITTVSLGDVVDQLHDKHSLSDSCSSEQTDLSSLSVWGQQIYDLNTDGFDLVQRVAAT